MIKKPNNLEIYFHVKKYIIIFFIIYACGSSSLIGASFLPLRPKWLAYKTIEKDLNKNLEGRGQKLIDKYDNHAVGAIAATITAGIDILTLAIAFAPVIAFAILPFAAGLVVVMKCVVEDARVEAMPMLNALEKAIDYSAAVSAAVAKTQSEDILKSPSAEKLFSMYPDIKADFADTAIKKAIAPNKLSPTIFAQRPSAHTP